MNNLLEMKASMYNLIDELILARKNVGLSVQDVSEISGMPSLAITHLENTKDASIAVLLNYAAAVGVNLRFSVKTS